MVLRPLEGSGGAFEVPLARHEGTPASGNTGADLRWWRGPGSLATWLLAFIPVWWVLGLGALIFPLLAIPMAVSLARRERVEVPPAFWLWLVFCAVAVVSLVTLNVDPTGTLPGGWISRLPGAGYRLVGYVCVTILVLYVVNTSEAQLPRRRLVNLLAWLAVVTVAGGLLGTFDGYFEFKSLVELLLPDSIANNGFVASLVHPQASQIMDFLGYETPRPAAPWGYTNTWGNVLSICVPWLAIAAFCYPTRRRTKVLAIAVGAMALVPAVESMNRGLWLNLAVAGCFVVMKLLVSGKIWPVVLVVATAILAVLVVAVTPLGQVVAARAANGHSDDGRGYATEQAVTVVAESPIVGFGSTRNAQGSGDSITVGPTQECPRCGGRTLGGNGQLWQTLVAHGYAGAITYVGFFSLVLWRFRRDHSAIGVVGSVVMVLSLTSMFYYNALLAPLALTMLCYALLWRNERNRAVEGIAR